MSLDAPLWRIVGSGASWLIFTFSFAAFVEGMFAVLGVGGTCADGGPYVIAVHCPENSNLFTLIGVYGGLAAVAIALILAREFGTRLIALAWPALFGTLGVVFCLGGGPFIVIGAFFLIMAAVPLAIELRGSVQRVFLGPRNALGQRFTEESWARTTMQFKGEINGSDAVAPTATDWALSLGLAVIPAALGVVAAVSWWNAVSPAGAPV
jgi:hypothetical protein